MRSNSMRNNLVGNYSTRAKGKGHLSLYLRGYLRNIDFWGSENSPHPPLPLLAFRKPLLAASGIPGMLLDQFTPLFPT